MSGTDVRPNLALHPTAVGCRGARPRVNAIVMRLIRECDGNQRLTHTIEMCSIHVYANQSRH
jgi:hypothetical protein